jgi:hypothetical protein
MTISKEHFITTLLYLFTKFSAKKKRKSAKTKSGAILGCLYVALVGLFAACEVLCNKCENLQKNEKRRQC